LAKDGDEALACKVKKIRENTASRTTLCVLTSFFQEIQKARIIKKIRENTESRTTLCVLTSFFPWNSNL
jgi:hypothetical protein